MGHTSFLTCQVVALCIGVSKYHATPHLNLKNPAKDAEDIAAKLKASGAAVTCLLNPTAVEMKEAISKFRHEDIKDDTQLAVFYFAGHGGFSCGHQGTGEHVMMASCWKNYKKPNFARVSCLAPISV